MKRNWNLRNYELLTVQELADLQKIDQLLHEANVHALAEDGYCKPSDGYLSVGFGNHWDRFDDGERAKPTVEIYSYLLGPHRNHTFDSVEDALRTVIVWHSNEVHGTRYPDPYDEIEAEREKRWRI